MLIANKLKKAVHHGRSRKQIEQRWAGEGKVYLRTQGLQLHGGHAHQLHALLVVGD